MSQLTPAEIENLRFHLGFGNLQVGAYPWTPDGFFEFFTNVIAVWLSTDAETSATTAIDASAGPVVVTVTPASMTGIAAMTQLVVDNGDDYELVVVKVVTGTTFTAKFSKSHTAAGYPVAVATGTSRVRYLMYQADRVHEAIIGPMTTAIAGLLSVDKGEVVYNGQDATLKGLARQYGEIVFTIGRLIRVEPLNTGATMGPMTRLEAY